MNIKKSFILLMFAFLSCGGNSGIVVSGKVQGLDGTLIIQNNGKDDIAIEKDGTFSFRVADKADYSIQMFREPCGQRCEIKNGKGTINEKSVDNVDITCLAKTWSDTQQFLKGTEFEKLDPLICNNVAMDRRGNMIALWLISSTVEDGSVGFKLYKSEFRNGEWIHPKENENINIIPSYAHIRSCKVVMNDNNAIIVWTEEDINHNYGVYKSQYQFGTWTDPTLLSDKINLDSADSVDVAINDGGDIIIVWANALETDAYGTGIFKSEFRNGKWINPIKDSEKINVGTQSVDFPKVAMNNDNAIVVWTQTDTSDWNIFKS